MRVQPTPDTKPIFLKGYHQTKGACPECGVVDSLIHTNRDGSVVEFPNPKVKAGRLGGASKSPAKVKAAKLNGVKGGRPKKKTT